MVRFALVHPGSNLALFERIAARIPACRITAVVEPNLELARDRARTLHAEAHADSIAALHEKHGHQFDAWLTFTPLGLIAVPHDNRPLDLRPATWELLPDSWVWGNELRFKPASRAVRDSLDSTKLGAPGLVRIHVWKPNPPGHEHRSLDRFDLLPALDLACSLVDQPVRLLHALARDSSRRDARPKLADSTATTTSAREKPADRRDATTLDYLQVHVGFEDDRMALIDLAAGLPPGDDYFALSVIAATGAAYADDHRDRQLVFRGGPAQARRSDHSEATLLAVLQDFVAATLARRPPACGRDAWRRALALAAAVHDSLATRDAVEIHPPAAIPAAAPKPDPKPQAKPSPAKPPAANPRDAEPLRDEPPTGDAR